MKIVVLDGQALNPGDLSWQGLADLGELQVYPRTPEEKIKARAQGAEVLLTNKTPLTAETIADLPDLKYIGVLATGYNVIDIKAAAEKGIVVTNVPAYGTDAVAQFVFALLLELAHHVGEHNHAVKDGAWQRADDFCFWNYPLVELQDKVIGLIGYGRIGQRTAELARAFKMKIVAYDRSAEQKKADPEINTANIKFLSLTDLYKTSDIISLHCPLTETTRDMINRQSIAQMKEGVIIINTARGELINETDLAAALESGQVSGAAVDVLAAEPPTSNNPLLNSENTIITPHIAWASHESRQRLLKTVVANLTAFFAGNPINQIN